MALTPKQQRFCEEFFVDLNATQAAVRSGYSEKTANRIASTNLAKPAIQAEIQRRQAEQAKKLDITAERVLFEYARLAFLDIRKAFDANGNLKPIHELDDDTAAAIAGMEIESETKESESGEKNTTTRTHKLKFGDKKGALDSLSKHLGIFNEGSSMNLVAFKVYLGFDPNDV